ncbi:LCP family glycopolymer transferase CpsA [Streptococcus cuniculipharyngis]|uniref:LytR family transcriptional regulator n=1 Tax=Streptococcus cuniculipharyngis TaxID=1562651 RepID=A0A5C5SDL8_9STRE|nr:LCP family protein [Streptococcus cuniculipharyngis]TWS97652.1 LytR family transcriptional regulator [Streptococcus cuniculipharyngis]
MASRRSRSRKRLSAWGVANLALLLVYTIVALMVIFTMYSYQFLDFSQVNVIYTVVLLIVFLLGLVLILLKKASRITTVLLTVVTLIGLVTLFFFKSTIDVTGKLNQTASFSEVEMSVVVPADSEITDVSQVTEIQAPVAKDRTNIESLLGQLQEEKGISLTPQEVDSYSEAYNKLTTGASKAMVLNSAYMSLLEDDYATKIKTIYSYKVKKEITPPTTDTQTNAGVFNIYISGIDTYGPISSVSRSDVNIIMTVNQNTNKVLLTTTPRDAYVQIPDGGNNQYDKLTHAGIYGVETSMKTLENLYGIKLDYYARINFTSFLTLIDLVGGIEVYNDQAFTSWTNSKYSFPVGNVSLNSEQALAFVRERYSLANGDNDRGKNQEKVIAAVINKLVSVNSLSNFSNIINGLGSSVQTNMPLPTMMSLANNQLKSGQSYTVVSQALTGTGSTGQLTSYAMPNASLYMMTIDDNSLATVKQAIQDTMEGR